ncbi:MAG TPA: hypothetical protein VGG48_00695 [Rhizomicrobium sp.]|jgi:hypothetical protein
MGFARKLACALCAGALLALGGCGFVVSNKQIFPQGAGVNDPDLAGIYSIRALDKSTIAVVRQRAPDGYDVAFFEERQADTGPAYFQSGATEFRLIPAGSGDYAMEISCYAGISGGGFGGTPKDPPFQYAMLLAARPRNSFWISIFPSGDKLQTYPLKRIDDSSASLDTLGPDQARAFFRDWADDALAVGGDNLVPVLRYTGNSGFSSTPQTPKPKACRDMPKMPLDRKDPAQKP